MSHIDVETFGQILLRPEKAAFIRDVLELIEEIGNEDDAMSSDWGELDKEALDERREFVHRTAKTKAVAHAALAALDGQAAVELPGFTVVGMDTSAPKVSISRESGVNDEALVAVMRWVIANGGANGHGFYKVICTSFSSGAGSSDVSTVLVTESGATIYNAESQLDEHAKAVSRLPGLSNPGAFAESLYRELCPAPGKNNAILMERLLGVLLENAPHAMENVLFDDVLREEILVSLAAGGENPALRGLNAWAEEIDAQCRKVAPADKQETPEADSEDDDDAPSMTAGVQ
ncbi:hypothetical protein [Alcanivorax sp. 1008]|uniref:hypothetical protein n=1 Tax=Alcanivorax sp. 1008 TaxID=2816853 RepID=UPI001E173454|nr:hypothetical protein [Alcanivorax sp. 1008]MCC1496871.1 hypothetical protein [Alcanivorax sp. 1008]